MKQSAGSKYFQIFNYIVLSVTAIICILPIINVLAISMSSSKSATAGYVTLFPVDFNLDSYKYALTKPEFIQSFMISIKRILYGYSINMIFCILVAYPLSKNIKVFRMRNIYAWFFITTMLFYGGLIPLYMTIRTLDMLNKVWALVLPTAVPVFFVILLMNFFRELPKEIEEAAYIDGAGHWSSLIKIYLPLSKPALATITLFILIYHWNSWFDGLIFMNSPKNYPLQSYLQTVIIGIDYSRISSAEFAKLSEVSDRTLKSAQVFLGALPIMLIYPFLQPFFMKGLIMGSVKG